MKCVCCGVGLSNNWKELVKDIENPQCGFCDGTMSELFNKSVIGQYKQIKSKEE